MDKLEILKEYFGYDSFREGQDTLIDGILKNKDVLGIMPTGAGKSLCYQIPALILEGITIVISPLISLMKDQVRSLCQSGVKAAYLNSSLTQRQQSLVLENALNYQYKIIYVAPERLSSYEFISFAKSVDIAMITVDEAHCISQWGQDFRPHYLEIPTFIEQLSYRPVVSAFTATATTVVREDIVTLLKLNNPRILVTGFNRENLYFGVQRPKKKFEAMVSIVKDYQDYSGIIYCMSRKNVENICEKLNKLGFKATRYHAGLSDKERKENQENFQRDNAQIMVATNAFGMGIDKSNVSYVIHYNMPKDLESYYQEAGRAGRDGLYAVCVLLFSPGDVSTVKWMINNPIDGLEYNEEKRKRDNERLKVMTDYGETLDCLRGYILRYFGDEGIENCGNCSNCNGEFEEIDITQDVDHVISCIKNVGGNYGANTIISILKGSKAEKVTRFGFEKLSCYNISNKTTDHLRLVIKEGIKLGLLEQTLGEYPLLKLGSKAMEKVMLKVKKEDSKGAFINQETNDELFAKLKELRINIAKERDVPAFVIFSDKTLRDMCQKLPINRLEFLQVSGVGTAKLEEFGAVFINVIKEYKQKHEKEISTNPTKILSNNEFIAILEEENQKMGIATLAKRISEMVKKRGEKRVSTTKITAWLVDQGYLEVVKTDETHTRKIPSPKGREANIEISKVEVGEVEYEKNLYPFSMQKLIVEHLDEM